MAKYRKRPIIIEAEQFLRDRYPWPDGVERGEFNKGEWAAWIETLEGRLDVRDGDWIVTGIVGERYPCRDDIFRQTYELVEEKLS